MRQLAIALGLAACCALLAGCVAVKPNSDGTLSYSFVAPGSKGTEVRQTSGPAPATTSKASKTAKSPRVVRKKTSTTVGKSLTSGVWKVTVESAKLASKLPDGRKPAAGHKLLLVDVAIQNTGISSTLEVHPEQFILQGPDGKTVVPFSTPLAAFNAQQVRPVGPGMGGATEFVYEVPSNGTGYRFFAKPMQDSSELMWIVL